MSINQDIARRVYQAVMSSNLTQKEIAQRAGCHRHTLGRMISFTEFGLPNANTLRKICKVLGVSVDYILYGETKGNGHDNN